MYKFVTFESDVERFYIFLGDWRAAVWMAFEDAQWWNYQVSLN